MQQVYLPWIKSLCREYDGWKEGMPITEEIKCVSWSDGDNAQIKTIIETVNEFNDHKICAMKQNAACKGSEQKVDLTLVSY